MTSAEILKTLDIQIVRTQDRISELEAATLAARSYTAQVRRGSMLGSLKDALEILQGRRYLVAHTLSRQ